MIQFVAQAVDLAQQTAPSSDGIGADGWKIISALCAFIAGLIVWIKALIAKIDAVQDLRISDLKDNAALVREDLKDGKIDGK
jgi:hypothetical protein